MFSMASDILNKWIHFNFKCLFIFIFTQWISMVSFQQWGSNCLRPLRNKALLFGTKQANRAEGAVSYNACGLTRWICLPLSQSVSADEESFCPLCEDRRSKHGRMCILGTIMAPGSFGASSYVQTATECWIFLWHILLFTVKIWLSWGLTKKRSRDSSKTETCFWKRPISLSQMAWMCWLGGKGRV